MRVMVREIDNGHASTPQAGLRLYALIEPVLARAVRSESKVEGRTRRGARKRRPPAGGG